MLCILFRQLLKTFGQLFNPASGHTHWSVSQRRAKWKKTAESLWLWTTTTTFCQENKSDFFPAACPSPPPSRCKQNFLAGCCCNKKLQKSKKAEKVNDQRKLLLLLLLLLLLVQTFKALKQLIIHRFGITIMDHVGRRRYWNESCTASINI